MALLRAKRVVRHSPKGDGGSNPNRLFSGSLDCFGAYAPRNDGGCEKACFTNFVIPGRSQSERARNPYPQDVVRCTCAAPVRHSHIRLGIQIPGSRYARPGMTPNWWPAQRLERAHEMSFLARADLGGKTTDRGASADLEKCYPSEQRC